VERCARRIAAAERRPPFQPVDPPEPEPTRIALGIIPDYADAEDRGVEIVETSPGGPARGAGLRAGDVIVRLGEHAIFSMHDYRIAIAEYRPGDVIAGVVLRAGRETPFSATLPPAPR
jgi:S1-C subfamily serine protease